MKLFLSKILKFVLVLFILGVGYDYFMSSILKKSTAAQGEYEVWTALYAGEINKDVLIYGSSRAWVHFDPEILGNIWNADVYNLGVDGYDFYMQYFRHEAYMKYNTIPKVIILSLDVLGMELKAGMYNDNQFVPYMYGDAFMYTELQIYGGYGLLDYYVPALRYFGKPEVLSYAYYTWKNPTASFRYKGFRSNEASWDENLEQQRLNSKPRIAGIHEVNIQRLEALIDWCRNNQVTLIFVYSPEQIDGRQYIENRAAITALYDSIAKKYNVPYFDYSSDTLCIDRKYFYNSSHLNASGAAIFSQTFANDVKEIVQDRLFD